MSCTTTTTTTTTVRCHFSTTLLSHHFHSRRSWEVLAGPYGGKASGYARKNGGRAGTLLRAGVKYLFVAEHKFYAAYFHAPLPLAAAQCGTSHQQTTQHHPAPHSTHTPCNWQWHSGSEAHKTFRCHSSGKV
uniref:HDC15803 n=1 Tax=Drosophila melanogaster TaxID=7227 RepID=Q6IJ65_DROME|nr:TPA_inf: HDC15803 [Drosophila melanogaster]